MKELCTCIIQLYSNPEKSVIFIQVNGAFSSVVCQQQGAEEVIFTVRQT